MAKRRGNREGSIYRRKSDGRWIAAISVRDISGRRRRITRLARSREHARILLNELKAENHCLAAGPARLTLGAFLQSWLELTIRPKRAANTHASYANAIAIHISPTLGRIQIAKLTAIHVQEWLAAMDKSGVGQRSRQNAFAVLSAGLANAVQLGIVTENVCRRIERPRYRRAELHPFAADETESILAHTADHRLAAVFRLALTTGMRQGELFGLRWEDVDFETGKLRVVQQAVEISGHVRFTPPKTRNGQRTIPLSTGTLNALHERRLAALREGHASAGLVFVSPTGRVIHRSNFGSRTWKTVLKKTGLAYRGFHHCRHTAATLMLGAGLPVHVVARVLGHSKPSVTLDLYAHWIRTDDSAVAETITRIIG